MKVTVVFIRVATKPEYRTVEERWLDSYWRNHAGYFHELVVINQGGDKPDTMFDGFASKYLRYDGEGWDCGAWQFAGKNIETDLLVCFNSSTYFTGKGWLKRFVEAVEFNGDGLYGPLASHEIIPHIRTPCMIFQPKIINGYPNEVMNREDTYRFESLGWPDGTPNFTQWVRQQGLKTLMVTWGGVYDQMGWRYPPDVFRRGTQIGLIIKDRHCDTYDASDAEGKAKLEALADGK